MNGFYNCPSFILHINIVLSIKVDNRLENSTREQILSQLPAYMAELDSLFESGEESFKELVYDYLLCKKEENRLTDAGKADRAFEYEEVFKKLEEELLEVLEQKEKLKKYWTYLN